MFNNYTKAHLSQFLHFRFLKYNSSDYKNKTKTTDLILPLVLTLQTSPKRSILIPTFDHSVNIICQPYKTRNSMPQSSSSTLFQCDHHMQKKIKMLVFFFSKFSPLNIKTGIKLSLKKLTLTLAYCKRMN